MNVRVEFTGMDDLGRPASPTARTIAAGGPARQIGDDLAAPQRRRLHASNSSPAGNGCRQ